jgi:hypothetical protein
MEERYSQRYDSKQLVILMFLKEMLFSFVLLPVNGGLGGYKDLSIYGSAIAIL